MPTTTIRMQFNMGYMYGEEERKLHPTDADKAELMHHLSDIMPEPEEFGVTEIRLDYLGTKPQWFGSEQDGLTCNLQMWFTIYYERTLSIATMKSIIDAVYENGANASYTPNAEDAYPHTILYPYHIIHELSDKEAPAPAPAPAPEEEDHYDDVYTPCPPRRPTKYNCKNCSPSLMTCDGTYPQYVDVCYSCERCGRTITHCTEQGTDQDTDQGTELLRAPSF